MNFLIIGASGRTGKLVLESALARHHHVTVLVRDPSLLEARKGLTIIQGTPTSPLDIEQAFESSRCNPISVVLVTLNARRASDSPFAKVVSPPRLLTDIHRHLIEAMKKYGCRKIVTMSAFGVGDSFQNSNFLVRCLIRQSNMKIQIEDHRLVDEMIKSSGLDFVIPRPAMLKGDKALSVKVYSDQGEGSPFMPKISRSSVAQFMVEAAEGVQYDGQTPVISNT